MTTVTNPSHVLDNLPTPGDSMRRTARNVERSLWQQLDRVAPDPFSRAAFVHAATETLAHRAHIRTVLAHDGTGGLGLTHLVMGPLSLRAQLLGAHALGEPMHVAATDGLTTQALAQALIALKIPLQFDRLYADGPMVAALQNAARGHASCRVTPVGGAPYIALHDGWREPESQFNAKRRSDLRRMSRTAAHTGAVTFESVRPTPREVDAMIETAFEIERHSWKGRQGTALAIDTWRGAFFRRYASNAAADGSLRMAFMRINGVAVAMQLGVVCAHRHWILKIGYDDRHARCSPGNLLMAHVIGQAAEAGLQSVEFLGACEAWTLAWTAQHRACVSLRTYPPTVRGITALAIDAGRRSARHGINCFRRRYAPMDKRPEGAPASRGNAAGASGR